MRKGYEIAAYYFPDYHQDERNDKWHGQGWTEWELVKRAEPRFEGHRQPRVPLWGYEDEASPEVMKKKINAAADNGISSFIFDWYWYEDGPYLQKCLEEGFLKAENNNRLKFSIMWANHDLADIHPAQRSRPYNVLRKGTVSRKTFEEATDRIIHTYFTHPSYWRVNGGLYFSIYELMNFIKGLGGLDAARTALDNFRNRVKAAGLGELHLNAVVWGLQILPGEEKITRPNEYLHALGFDSTTSYVWIHHQEMKDFPKSSYAEIRDASIKDYLKFTNEYDIPYYPNVTVGWDASPRTIQSDKFENMGYPAMPILDGNTPEEFRKALEQAKIFLDRGLTNPRILTVNAWNEWTEGSYLEPDTEYGMRYLEAIREVFG
ncbi:MAG: glycoside hydrolase family 99-like domain-containing protein [Clostridiaceae bacterium]